MRQPFIVQQRDLADFLKMLERFTKEIEKELLADGTWLIIATFPDGRSNDPEAVVDDPGTGADTPPPAREATPVNSELGVLSATYESGGRSSAAIGRDKVGGYSYGKYQIATKTGTMASFIAFCKTSAPTVASALEASGGVAAALDGAENFKTKWRELAQGPDLSKAEHSFIQATHYAPFVERLNGIGLHVARRSWALKNVVWSVAVQHGAENSVVKNALDPMPDPAELSDKDIIKSIYKERSNVNKYFSRSTKKVKDSVKKRFKQELADALEMLKLEG